MAEKVVMIALSPTMDDGKIQKWNIKEGDKVSNGQVICEVETDKSVMDYEAFNEGVVLKIVVGEGGKAKVGQTIAVFGKKGEDISALIAEEQPEPAAAKPAPAVMKAASTAASTVVKAVSSAASAAVNAVSAVVNSTPAAPVQHASSLEQDHIRATPLARRRAQELGIDLSMVQGSGANGRIQRIDVEGGGAAPIAASRQQSQAAAAKPAPAPVQFDTEIPVEGVRAIIAQRLSESMFSSPHFYVKASMRTESMVSLRTKLNAAISGKISLNAFIIKLVASALKKNPMINSSWIQGASGSSIVHHSSIDIALAVDVGTGLITPVVRRCHTKTVQQIDQELQGLIQKVKQKSITPDEYSNATFTISNLGSFGVEEFTAIINPPASCILSVGMNQKVPCVNDAGAIEIASLMTCILSSDHRVIDGTVAAQFMKDLRSIVETPAIALYF